MTFNPLPACSPQRVRALVAILLACVGLWLMLAGLGDGELSLAAAGPRPAVALGLHVITVGVAADLSGPVATIGELQVRAVQLAISQSNAAGGIDIGGQP